MSKESAVRTQLESAGFVLVQTEPRLPGVTSSVRPDFLAWAADGDGVLVPWAAVEVKKTRARVHPDRALLQLASVRDQLGTVDHYVVVDGQWQQADRSMRVLTAVEGPGTPDNGVDGTLEDVAIATSLIHERLWDVANDRRGSSDGINPLELFAELMPNKPSGELTTRSGAAIRVPKDVLWRAGRRALNEFATRDQKSGLFVSRPAIAGAVAHLAGDALDGTVMDPFCGTGEFLWAAADHAEELNRSVDLTGMDLDRRMVAIAASLASAAPRPTRIFEGDSFKALPTEVDVVLSAPPLGVRLQAPYALLNGTRTLDGDLAAVDVAVRSLRAGGRAVLQVSPGVTFRKSGSAYRRFLSEEYRVAALIGCPPGTIPGTGIGSVLLVIDKCDPTTTFVAQLGGDWEEQLAADGPALTAALGHLRNEGAEVRE
ncbi:N-6 DNA methylase [Rhodococcus hoagii]|nr:N-6 DNA methylase [Prescottella equi]